MEEDEAAAGTEEGAVEQAGTKPNIGVYILNPTYRVRLVQPFVPFVPCCAVWGRDKGHLAGCCGEMKA